MPQAPILGTQKAHRIAENSRVPTLQRRRPGHDHGLGGAARRRPARGPMPFAELRTRVGFEGYDNDLKRYDGKNTDPGVAARYQERRHENPV